MANCVIGVDLGGTNVRAQAIYPDGSPAGGYKKNSSFAQQGTDAIIDAVANTIREALASAGLMEHTSPGPSQGPDASHSE